LGFFPAPAAAAAAAEDDDNDDDEDADSIVCVECGQATGDAELLLCDAREHCAGARHTFCCTPPLLEQPAEVVGEWFCSPACEKQAKSSKRKRKLAPAGGGDDDGETEAAPHRLAEKPAAEVPSVATCGTQITAHEAPGGAALPAAWGCVEVLRVGGTQDGRVDRIWLAPLESSGDAEDDAGRRPRRRRFKSLVQV
jgi:hypothetical protein